MKSIKEIFKGKEHLLETDEMKDVFKSLAINLETALKLRRDMSDKIFRIEEIIYNSEKFIIGGYSVEKVIDKIFNELNAK